MLLQCTSLKYLDLFPRPFYLISTLGDCLFAKDYSTLSSIYAVCSKSEEALSCNRLGGQHETYGGTFALNLRNEQLQGALQKSKQIFPSYLNQRSRWFSSLAPPPLGNSGWRHTIDSAQNLNQLRDILVSNVGHHGQQRLDASTLGTALDKVSSLAGSVAAQMSEQATYLDTMSLLASHFITQLYALDPSSIVKILHTFGRLGYPPMLEEGMRILADWLIKGGVMRILSEPEGPQKLVDVAWAFGRFSYENTELMNMLSSSIIPHLPRMRARTIAKFAQAASQSNFHEYYVFNSIVEAANSQLRNMDGGNYASLLTALRRVQHIDNMFMDLVAKNLVLYDKLSNTKDFAPHQIVSIMWALAGMRFLNSDLYHRAALVIAKNSRVLKAKNLCNMAWAYAKRGQWHHDLYSALALQAISIMDTFKPSNVSITLWAFAKQYHASRERVPSVLHPYLQRSAGRLVTLLSSDLTRAQVSLQNMSNSAWALAKFRYSDPTFWVLLLDHAENLIASGTVDMKPQNLSDLCWALGEICQEFNIRQPSLMNMIEQRTLSSINEFGVLSSVDMMVGIAKQGEPRTELMDALARHAQSTMNRFGPESLGDLLYACARARYLNEELLRLAAAEAWGKWEKLKDNNDALAKVMWALDIFKIPQPQLFQAFRELHPEEAASLTYDGTSESAGGNLMPSSLVGRGDDIETSEEGDDSKGEARVPLSLRMPAGLQALSEGHESYRPPIPPPSPSASPYQIPSVPSIPPPPELPNYTPRSYTTPSQFTPQPLQQSLSQLQQQQWQQQQRQQQQQWQQQQRQQQQQWQQQQLQQPGTFYQTPPPGAAFPQYQPNLNFPTTTSPGFGMYNTQNTAGQPSIPQGYPGSGPYSPPGSAPYSPPVASSGGYTYPGMQYQGSGAVSQPPRVNDASQPYYDNQEAAGMGVGESASTYAMTKEQEPDYDMATADPDGQAFREKPSSESFELTDEKQSDPTSIHESEASLPETSCPAVVAPLYLEDEAEVSPPAEQAIDRTEEATEPARAADQPAQSSEETSAQPPEPPPKPLTKEARIASRVSDIFGDL